MSNTNQGRLYFFTNSYPYTGGRDRSFVEPQLKYLAKHFDSVVLVPYLTAGEPYLLPDGIVCDTSLSKVRLNRFFNPMAWAMLFKNTEFIREIVRRPGQVLNALRYALLANAVALWARTNVKASLCYTLSMNAVTKGLAQLRENRSNFKVVCRCIGGDVNEDAHPTGYIPFKSSLIKSVDRIFPCSQTMLEMLRLQHPAIGQRAAMARFGVLEQMFDIKPSQDGTRRVVSCGAMISAKRYELLAEAMSLVARQNPSIRYHWRHIPLGDTSDFFGKWAAAGSPENLQIVFEEESVSVMEIYQKINADLFVHVSRSEGIPLVIMEALSCGLPVMATDVGGISELIDDSVGRLIPVATKPESLALHLEDLLRDTIQLQSKKRVARDRWGQLVSADHNYDHFARLLATI